MEGRCDEAQDGAGGPGRTRPRVLTCGFGVAIAHGACLPAFPTPPNNGVPERADDPSWTANLRRPGARHPGSDGMESPREAYTACHHKINGSKGTLALDEPQEVGSPAPFLGGIFPFFYMSVFWIKYIHIAYVIIEKLLYQL